MALALQKIYDLSGRVALVTGGGTGIGFMIASGLAVNGAKVYLCGRREDVLEQAAKSVSSSHPITPIVVDVTKKESILAAVKTLEQKEGKLHILVNNAGQVGPVSRFFNDLSSPQHKDAGTLGAALFENESFESWGQLYSINLFSIFFMTTAFIGLLAKGSEDTPGYTASVINITSMSGTLKLAQDHFAYNTSKAAATHLTKLLSTELALKGVPVRVNSIAPGVYVSEMTRESIESAEATNDIAKCIIPIPAGRPGSAEEMAGTVIYLASPAGCYTNGQEIVIDGGALAVNPSTA